MEQGAGKVSTVRLGVRGFSFLWAVEGELVPSFSLFPLFVVYTGFRGVDFWSNLFVRSAFSVSVSDHLSEQEQSAFWHGLDIQYGQAKELCL